MREERSKRMTGTILFVLGVLLILKAIIGFTSHLLFEGWWAVAIVALAVVDIVKEGWNKKNGTWAIIGGVLFINCKTHFLGFIIGSLLIPVVLLLIGIRLITKSKAY